MMILKRAADAMEDKQSVTVNRRLGFTHLDLEAAIIKATSHDSSSLNYKHSRVFTWTQTSPSSLSLSPLLSISKRLHKTRSWVVALKGLLLIHDIFCSKSPQLLTRVAMGPYVS
ncbi:hypothetical protein AMTRI_Chr04g182870 [Amborella trichopoda]